MNAPIATIRSFEPKADKPKAFDAEKAMQAIKETLGYDFTEKTNRREYADARFCFYALCVSNGISMAKAGAMMGKNHSSIWNGLNKFSDLYKTCPTFRELALKLLGPASCMSAVTWVNDWKVNRAPRIRKAGKRRRKKRSKVQWELLN